MELLCIFQSQARVREGIDFVGTLSEFYDYHLTAMIHFVLEFPGMVEKWNIFNFSLRSTSIYIYIHM